MQENVDKHLEDLTRKVMKTPELESPSFNFKSAVMAEIEGLELSSTTKYVPLISKRSWVLIGVALLAVILYFIFSGITITAGWLSKIGIERFYNFEISNPLADLNMSTTLIYAIGLFGLMLTVQIPLLKRYFDQRLSV